MKYVITENERRDILGLYGIHREEQRPFGILAECRFTSDGKFVVYEGIAYSCETGDQVPLNEAWTLSDTLHTIGDVASAGMDFIIPGSGAIIDIINTISYLIEAQFTTDPEKKKSLYIMGAITAGFVVIPGALQGVAIPLKRFIKSGKAVKSAAVAGGINIVGKSIGKILNAIPSLLNRVLKTKLGSKMLGKHSAYLTRYLDDIIKGVRSTFDNFATTAANAAKVGTKNAISALSVKSLLGFTAKTGKQIIRNGTKVLRKNGFAIGRSYRYLGPKGVTTVTIKEITEDGVIMTGKVFGQASAPIGTFLYNAVGAPWLRRGKSVLVPLFVKRFANMLLPDGSGINETALDQTPDADPDQTSQESLAYLEDEVASYEGDKGSYTVQTPVTNFQNALMMLGYDLPRFGADGKFGPETQEQLKRFQTDFKLESSIGKMDRLTAKTLGTALKNKNVQNSQDLQNTLNSI